MVICTVPNKSDLILFNHSSKQPCWWDWTRQDQLDSVFEL